MSVNNYTLVHLFMDMAEGLSGTSSLSSQGRCEHRVCHCSYGYTS